jgi:hypothetical protein
VVLQLHARNATVSNYAGIFLESNNFDSTFESVEIRGASTFFPRRSGKSLFRRDSAWQQTKPSSLIITFTRVKRDIAIVVTSVPTHNRHSLHSNPKPLLSSHHFHETRSLCTPKFATAFLDQILSLASRN